MMEFSQIMKNFGEFFNWAKFVLLVIPVIITGVVTGLMRNSGCTLFQRRLSLWIAIELGVLFSFILVFLPGIEVTAAGWGYFVVSFGLALPTIWLMTTRDGRYGIVVSVSLGVLFFYCIIGAMAYNNLAVSIVLIFGGLSGAVAGKVCSIITHGNRYESREQNEEYNPHGNRHENRTQSEGFNQEGQAKPEESFF